LEYYLPIFVDGIRCMEDPCQFIARQVGRSILIHIKFKHYLYHREKTSAHGQSRVKYGCRHRVINFTDSDGHFPSAASVLFHNSLIIMAWDCVSCVMLR
jgi:hypothetical protein